MVRLNSPTSSIMLSNDPITTLDLRNDQLYRISKLKKPRKSKVISFEFSLFFKN